MFPIANTMTQELPPSLASLVLRVVGAPATSSGSTAVGTSSGRWSTTGLRSWD